MYSQKPIDKTGTLTTGRIALLEVLPLGAATRAEALALLFIIIGGMLVRTEGFLCLKLNIPLVNILLRIMGERSVGDE